MFKNKKILITGGTGTWGQEFTRQLLNHQAEKIVIFSRNEAAQVTMRQEFGDYRDRICYVIGDVRDLAALEHACKDIDIVFHTAALKHVGKCEEQPREALATNVLGTANVISACISRGVNICVNISTDKVCDATSFYGHTKAIAESLIIEANRHTVVTNFINIRSGNIFGSSGSVVKIWHKQIVGKEVVTITDDDMTRFFITVADAVKCTFQAMFYSPGGATFILKMKSFAIGEVLAQLIERYGYKNDMARIRKIGMQPGERLHESVFTKEEVPRIYEEKSFYVLLPNINIDRGWGDAKGFKIGDGRQSNSSFENIGSEKDLIKMIESSGL